MKYPMPFNVDRDVTPPLSSDEDAEALNLIGWCWGAPATVRFVTGKLVYMDMQDRTVRRLSAVMVT